MKTNWSLSWHQLQLKSDPAGATCSGGEGMLRQWWACCPGSRLTSGGRCSCTGPGRCAPPAQRQHYQTCPGSGCCSRPASAARSPTPAGAGSSAHWSVGEAGFFSVLFSNVHRRCDRRVSPAQWSVCSWRCWDHGAPLQNTESLWDLGQESDPPGTAAELERTEENQCFKGFRSYRFHGIAYTRHSDT